MTLRMLFRFLVGDRQAILTIAHSPQSLWVGGLLVLSAGFAREYDGEDLRAEPWHLLIPWVASLGASFLLFLFVYFAQRRNGADTWPFWRGYREFLSLFWMTAPLAWLYAIPAERFLPPESAVIWNLWMLGIVAAWRVLLMIRCMVVLLGATLPGAVAAVMFFCSTVAAFVFFVVIEQVVVIMAGIRATGAEQAAQNAAFNVGMIGLVTWPIWLLGFLWLIGDRRYDWHLSEKKPSPAVSTPLKILMAASFLIWIPVLPFTQGEQQSRRHFEKLIADHAEEDAVRYLIERSADDFAPGWIPLGKRPTDTDPRGLKILEAIAANPTPNWVRELLVARALEIAAYQAYGTRFTPGRIERLLVQLETLPEAGAFIASEPDILYYGGFSEVFLPDQTARWNVLKRKYPPVDNR